MFALTDSPDPTSLYGVMKMISEGGAFVLLGLILVWLARRAPGMIDKVADSHVAAIKQCSEANTKAIESANAAQAKLVDAFQTEAREARSVFRQEQEAGRQLQASLIRDERLACDARSARLETRLDDHAEKLDRLGDAVSNLTARKES